MESLNSDDQLKLKLELTDKELEDVKKFVKAAQSISLHVKDEEMAIKFLRAKKFNIESSLDLFQKHEAIRLKENLMEINPFENEILNELLSKKFTFLVETDGKSGASICIFTARLHNPSKTSHQNVLKALIFQLDAILKSPVAQKNGLIFIYDMTGSLYSNFDMSLSVKILNLLKGAYPARLCKVIIFTPPLWFRAAFNFLRLFVKDKLQKRVWILTKDEELHNHLTKEILPPSLGGYTKHTHTLWLIKAFKSLGYPYEFLNSDKNHQICNGISQLKNPSNDSDVPDNTSTCSNPLENGHSIALEYDESVASDLTNGTYELVSKTDESVSSPITLGEISGISETPDNFQAASSFDIASSSAVDIVNQKTISNNPYPSSHTSISSGIGSSALDSKESDYDMLSISSWELNLNTSGDEDVIEDEDKTEANENEKSLNGSKTIENTPNVHCSSVRTPYITLEKPSFFQKVQLKRRNAVRDEYRTSDKKYSWAYDRPERNRSLHNALSDDNNYDDDEKGVSIDFFAESEKHSFYATLNEFRNDSIYGEPPQFTSYSNPLNAPKNRYSDIPCIESSRVKLVRHINFKGNISEGEILKPTDYIHANWVDGYRQINAYICTQGPLSITASDFWHMIIQYRAPIIVMTTRPREQNRDKCFQYWPEGIKETKIISGLNNSFDSFEVTSLRSKEFGPDCPKEGICNHANSHWYRVTLLHIKNLRTGQEHRVNHFYFHSWPDQGIPNSSEGFLHFILQIRRTYKLNIAKLGYESEMDQKIPPPPIVVHCSAGIGRTGTFILTEICSKSLTDCGRFSLHQTMLKLRSQRYKCVQNAYQYLYCRNTIVDYAKHVGLLNQTNNSEEDEEVQESDGPDIDPEEEPDAELEDKPDQDILEYE